MTKKGKKEDNQPLSLEVNPDAIEPKDYFKILKGKTCEIELGGIEKALETIARHILTAKQIGQETFIRKLAFSGNVLLKEQILYQEGFKKFVLLDDIKHYIDNVKPANSVKIIELERYPRAIPLICMETVAKTQKKNLFDKYCVVFTDLSNAEWKTPKEKAVVTRNRDPIIFGFYLDEETGHKHDRFYYVTDWEDKMCHLTFDKMVNAMKIDHKIKNPVKEISTGEDYIQTLFDETLKETSKVKDEEKKDEKKDFWSYFPWLKSRKR